MKRRDYFNECRRLSGVMAEKNEAFANFVTELPEDDFEEFDAHQAALSKAIIDWQNFCNENRSKLTD
ncbi:hypothetical protein [Pseudomonas mandelii]|uniref:hypothetical protein n=1 Tax=Pseudomonas mandelii TaxID=75612 RepID=UPI00037918E0|nr:hypothetical protein [Pseudomonas mandelii]